MAAKEMREPTFLILTALAGGRNHGYALIREAEVLSGGRVRLKVGTLYAALDRLTNEGLVVSAGEATVEGRARRYYELSPNGEAVLAEAAERSARVAAEAQARLAALRGMLPAPAAGTAVRGGAL